MSDIHSGVKSTIFASELKNITEVLSYIPPLIVCENLPAKRGSSLVCELGEHDSTPFGVNQRK